MSRSAYEIAESALDDLYHVQDAFIEFNAMFTLMLGQCRKDNLAHAFAELGLASVENWSEKLQQWSACIDHELDGVKREAEAYSQICARLLASRDAAKAIGERP